MFWSGLDEKDQLGLAGIKNIHINNIKNIIIIIKILKGAKKLLDIKTSILVSLDIDIFVTQKC